MFISIDHIIIDTKEKKKKRKILFISYLQLGILKNGGICVPEDEKKEIKPFSLIKSSKKLLVLFHPE